MATSLTSRLRPGQINLHESGDYPIILGDSLNDKKSAKSSFMQLRYNWQPKDGFQNKKGILKAGTDDLRLIYQDKESSSTSYTYSSVQTSSAVHDDDVGPSQLVLVFDESKSAFVLERISTSVDFNLTSAFDQSKEEVRKHRQLRRSVTGSSNGGDGGQKLSTSDGEDAVDPSNPYDFRNFLSEAKESIEKASQHGNRTPIPGSSTPLNGLSSPSLAAGRFVNTPTFRPTSGLGIGLKKTRPSENGNKATAPVSKKPPPAKRKDNTASKPSSSKPLSKERISDSDEEADDTITVAPKRSSGGHTRNISSTGASLGRSPHIVINDGDLEVDMGSPPRPVKRGPRIDPNAFRSMTNTPLMGRSSNREQETRSKHDEDIEMKDHNGSEDEAEDEDDDVDELELGSPQHDKTPGRTQPSQSQIEAAPTPPTPLPLTQDDDEFDETLAAELEAALGEEDDDDEDDNHAGHTRGSNAVHTGYGHVNDDEESEISEEE